MLCLLHHGNASTSLVHQPSHICRCFIYLFSYFIGHTCFALLADQQHCRFYGPEGLSIFVSHFSYSRVFILQGLVLCILKMNGMLKMQSASFTTTVLRNARYQLNGGGYIYIVFSFFFREADHFVSYLLKTLYLSGFQG